MLTAVLVFAVYAVINGFNLYFCIRRTTMFVFLASILVFESVSLFFLENTILLASAIIAVSSAMILDDNSRSNIPSWHFLHL